MVKSSFAHWPCSVARTVDVLGDAWSMLVLREAFYGIRRFDDFQSSLGIARNTLTERLNRLVDGGLMERDLYQSGPRRYEYVLTPKGTDFFGVLAAISSWGDRWIAEDGAPPVVFHHDSCGHDMRAQTVCSECGELLAADACSMKMGPGYPDSLRRREDVRRRFGVDDT
jgi:DNA-binding HxlR family transcriptional regulator